MSQIYTTGYTGQDILVLPCLLDEMNAVLCDIRFSPMSRHEQWRERSLRTLLGKRYVHLVELGNESFKIGEIRLHQPRQGLLKIKTLSDLYDAVILMCACDDFDHCHRSIVAEELQAEGSFVEEIVNWQAMLDEIKQPALF